MKIVNVARTLLALALFAAGPAVRSQVQSQVQSQEGAGAAAQIDIGGGYSVMGPVGEGWRATDASGSPASYLKILGPESHSLALIADTGPSGITPQEIRAIGRPNAADQVVKLIGRFVSSAWKSHAAGLQDARYETVETVNETGGKYSFGKFFCGYSRIVVRDRGAMMDGVPAMLRHVAYSCITFPDMVTAASVTYSERGREQDLSSEAMAEGERFALSLQRRP